MPGCAAVGCNNRSEKGYIMKCFPRDPKLRKIWQERVARADWKPSNNSFLCHVHFEPQEWSITQSGRIRLKKNAVPSIFTVTSTRKSPKKRNLEGKDSDYQDTEELLKSFTFKNSNRIHWVTKMKSNCDTQHQGEKDSKENMIIFSDDCNEIDASMKENEIVVHIKENDNKSQDANGFKSETKLKHTQNKQNDSYDEIEEKLKKICDGRSMNDENRLDKTKSCCFDNTQNEDLKSDKISFNSIGSEIVSVTCKDSKEISNILTDDRENVKIIFGIESADENFSVRHSEVTNSVLGIEGILCIKEGKKMYNEDIEENFGKDEVHVIPNMRAAMKRKRRTREEIMKSIKKSIDDTLEQDVNVENSSNFSDNTADRETFLHQVETDCHKTGKIEFTIKVTGDAEDVCEIVEELTSKNDERHNFEEVHSSYRNYDNKTVLTSVIALKDCFVDVPCQEDDSQKRNLFHNDIISAKKRKSVTSESPSFFRNFARDRRFQSYNFDKESFIEKPAIYDISYKYQLLQQRCKMQDQVIEKLTNQIINFKNIENNLQSQTVLLQAKTKEVETLTHKLNSRPNTGQLPNSNEKHADSKQRLVQDLSNRVNYLEALNKKLMKTMTLEAQQKRKLEGNIKQRDDQIKELNWKLEKASKYLERAEKNTNTYRRKMLNMQTIMRRKKLLDEKMTWFSEMLVDSSKGEFSEKTLKTAATIRRDCGKVGYNRLIDCGFPLPPLAAIRKLVKADILASKASNSSVSQNNSNKHKKSEPIPPISIKKETEVVVKTEVPALDVKDSELNGMETITGTVQDIFNETNDGDDFTSSELKEHFMEQLSTVM